MAVGERVRVPPRLRARLAAALSRMTAHDTTARFVALCAEHGVDASRVVRAWDLQSTVELLVKQAAQRCTISKRLLFARLVDVLDEVANLVDEFSVVRSRLSVPADCVSDLAAAVGRLAGPRKE